ncbi:hypothetical protein NESM_000165500 [Novymonas esmeraldas]|uniref:TOG domain-containing protein n=1 Tax=Novymonas esmeraldas TaxID=1808958 RepID=A0AAW0F3D9_9TRYP
MNLSSSWAARSMRPAPFRFSCTSPPVSLPFPLFGCDCTEPNGLIRGFSGLRVGGVSAVSAHHCRLTAALSLFFFSPFSVDGAKTAMSMDDRPVGGGSGPKAFGGGGAAAEAADNFSSCSMAELLAHSNWKARKEGFERVQKDPVKYKKLLLDSLKLVASEGNAMVQEAAIEAIVVVLSECNEAERAQLAEGTLAMVTEKGITGRPKAVQVSQQFIFALVEEGCGGAVFAALLPAFAHKTPKNRLAAAQTATSLVSDYGVRHFPSKEILKAMQPLFSDANAQVRKEAVALCCQCYRYIGANIKSFLTDLRDVQLQELQKQFESITVGERPPKTIKGGGDGGAGKDSSAVAKPIGSLTGDIDATVVDGAGFELLEESAVVSRLPKKFFRVALDKETTWQDRVEYVTEHLVPLLAAPRFRAKDDYHELASMIKEYLVDPQAPLMLLGFKMVQDCARGLRGDFGPHARLYVAPLLDKMKDKKVSVQLHVMKTLEELFTFNCLFMDQCNDEFEQALQSKNPTQRTAVLSFLIRIVDALGDRSRYAKLGRSTGMLTRVVNDEKASIRDVAYVLLDRLVQVFGEAQYKSVLASLDDNQRQNMASAVARGAPAVGPRAAAGRPASSTTTPQSGGPSGATPFNSPAKKVARVEEPAANATGLAPPPRARTASAAGPSAAARRLPTRDGEDEPVSDAGNRVARLPPRNSSLPRGSVASVVSATERGSIGGSRVATSRSSGAEPASGLGASRAAAEDSVALESALPAKMESVTAILGLTHGDSAVLDMVRSREWARRQEGVNKLLAMVQEWTPAQTARAMEHLVVYVRAHPSFREPTFQVFALVAQVFQAALSKVTVLTAAAGYALVSGFTSRLAEPKNKSAVREVCGLVAAKLGQRFAVRHMLDTAAVVKTPKLLQEVCEYVREAVQQQPDSEEAVRDTVEARGALHFVKTVCADVNNTGVRQEAVLLLVALRRSPHVSAAVVERCVASLPPPLPAMYERELNRAPEAGALAASLPPTRGSALPPTRAPAPATPATADLSPPSPIQKRVRTTSQSPGPGTRASTAALPSPSRLSTHRRSLSDAELAPSSVHRTSSVGGIAAPSRLASGRTSSMGPSPRNSSAASPVVSAGLRPILHEISAGADWRDRLNGVRRAEALVAEAPRPLPGHTAVTLLKALQGRFEEANKNIVVDVLRFIPVVVDAAGPEECRAALRQLTPGVLAMLGDQKTALREEARTVAFLAMSVVGLESMLPLLQRPLSSDSNACRQNALEMMARGFEQLPAEATLPRAGMQLLTPAVIASIMDRLLEVRQVAEQVLGWMLGVVGEDAVMHCVQKLKPAEQQAVMPAVERQIEHQRRTTQEVQREEAPRQEPGQRTPPAVTACAAPAVVANGLHDNEESRRTTPRPATPRVSAPGTPRRRSVATTPHEGRPAAAAAAASARQGTSNGTAAPERVPERAAPPRHAHVESTAVAPASPPPPPSRQPPASSSVARKDAPTAPTAPAATATSARVSRASVTAPTAELQSPQRAAPRTPVTPADGSLLAEGNEEMYTVREILAGLRSATSGVALAMCRDFGRHLRAGVDCGTPEVVQVMVERLYDNTRSFDSDLAPALIECLTALFMTPRCAQRCHSQLLFRMMGAFFDCLLSEKFALHEQVIKALNATMLRLLEGCPANDVFSALLSRLTTYSTAYLATGQKGDLKFIQVTVKCVMRVDFAQVGADTTILCCHEYLLQHPPSAFRNLDDLPIRTVKTVLQTATKRHGPSLLTTAEALVGPQNLVAHFIRACLELREKATKEKGDNEQQAIEESRHEQRVSQSPAPTPAKEKSRTSPPPSATPTRAAAAAASAPAATATPSKGSATPSRRKKRVSQHADPNVARAASLNSTAVAASNASFGSQSTPHASSRTLRTPVKEHPRLKDAATVSSQSAPAATTAAAAPPTATGAAPARVADVKKDLTEIFAHIRNHVTSSSGIDELYSFLKESPPTSYGEAFRVQFNRCSEAFRLYIKRKLERKVEEDTAKPASFALPPVIQNLS